MGKIKKTVGPKHEATLSPALSKFVTEASHIPLFELPHHLSSLLPPRWPFPRGDLYHWILLLNRFDHILELFIQDYQLDEGPQTQAFGRRILLRGDDDKDEGSDATRKPSEATLDDHGFSEEGDRELVENILDFSRKLLENCGNRSLYSSSGRLNDLLNTCSLSLLTSTLRLGIRLAQRYHSSRARTMGTAQHVNSTLLANHYNINLDRVQKIAAPFIKSLPIRDAAQARAPGSSGPKGTDKATPTNRASGGVTVLATDLVNLVKEEAEHQDAAKSSEKHISATNDGWQDWGGVSFTYYPTSSSPKSETKSSSTAGPSDGPTAEPGSPTPFRRTSHLGQQQTLRRSRLSTSEDSGNPANDSSPAKKPDHGVEGVKTVEIPFAKISSTPTCQILSSMLPEVPQDSRFDLLHRLRVAGALTCSLERRREIVAIRILAMTNLAYIFPELAFQQKVLQQDSDEPRRLQLAYQLAELVHNAGDRGSGVPRWLQTIALGGLEALAKHKAKAGEVCAALNVNVNHGVLLYIIRRAVAGLAVDSTDESEFEEDEWREALFSLLAYLPSTARTGEALVSAGLIPILLEVLSLRSDKAERTHHRILNFLDTFVYGVRDAFQTLANAKGLDIISDLTEYEVTSAFARAKNGEGTPAEYRNQSVDYEVPFFQQQTLRWLFKFVNHMMSHSGGNFDRLLRNLIDSPQLLGGLRTVIGNSKIFGSNVWSGAVNILSNFINNEPTSYAVIAEAGLTKCFLEAVTGAPIVSPQAQIENADVLMQNEGGRVSPSATEDRKDHTEAHRDNDSATANNVSEGQNSDEHDLRPISIPQEPLAQGILPATEAIVTVPPTFGAICLNTAGMKLFQDSHALESFFEVFFSPEHVKCMSSEADLPNILGSSFDELVRHHPPLKKSVMGAVLTTVIAVGQLCRSQARLQGVGAKLWIEKENGQTHVSGGRSALNGSANRAHDAQASDDEVQPSDLSGDVEMAEAGRQKMSPLAGLDESVSHEDILEKENSSANRPSVSAYLDVLSRFLSGYFSNTLLCANFIEQGGAEWFLDLAMLPSLQHDFNSQLASQSMSRVIHVLVEQKPHLVLPSLLKRTQAAVNDLRPFYEHKGKRAFFEPLIDTAESTSVNGANRLNQVEEDIKASGTFFAKTLVTLHTLCSLLCETFSQHLFNHRPSSSVFNQVNLADMYVNLVTSLGSVQRACVWERIMLQKAVPDTWKAALRIKGFVAGSDDMTNLLELLPQSSHPEQNPSSEEFGQNEAPPGEASGTTSRLAESKNGEERALSEEDTKKAQFKNSQILQHLLSQIPTTITPFFQGLGRFLIPKRQSDPFQKQNAIVVAEALAGAALEQLNFFPNMEISSVRDQYTYLLSMLRSLSQLMVEGPLERPQPQNLTLILQAFRNKGGFEATNRILELFFDEIKAQDPNSESSLKFSDASARLGFANDGVKIILAFYSQIVNSKNIIDASQTAAITSRERDRDKPDYFSPQQFVVELRWAVLPTIKALWDSDRLDKSSSSIVKSIIEILRLTLEADHETGAYKRSDKITPKSNKSSPRHFAERQEHHERLVSQGYDADIVSEALYRCNNHLGSAEDYCKLLKNSTRAYRNKIPDTLTREISQTAPSTSNIQGESQEIADISEATQASMAPPMASNGQSVLLENPPQMEVEEAGIEGPPDTLAAPPPAPGIPFDEGPPRDGVFSAMSLDNILENLTAGGRPPGGMLDINGEGHNGRRQNHSSSSPSPENGIEAGKIPEVVTFDDLDEIRATICRHVIERSLDVLSVHSDVTFELADLLMSVVSKSLDPDMMRREVGVVLVQSLMSLQTEDDSVPPAGKKVASYAHLLGLVLQDRDFLDANSTELRDNFGALVGFVKVVPNQSVEDSSPWIGQILLTLEKLLAENSQPQQIKWTAPSSENAPAQSPVAELDEPAIPVDEKAHLFEAIVDILPHVGKDESLALSVTRTLVILTRDRSLAIKLGERRNLQRLFVMMKQLAGLATEKLQSVFMLVLRHVVEDESTLRQIMQSEIKAYFELRQSTRQLDTNNFVQGLSHLVLRAPEIFVEVSNDMLKLVRFDINQRHQTLMLKKSEESDQDGVSATLDETGALKDGKVDVGEKGDVKPTTEQVDSMSMERSKSLPGETKTPVVENPDGVIHYLLCELLSYKDVEDKESSKLAGGSKSESNTGGQSDVDMEDISTPPSANGNPSEQENKRPEKPVFKAENHPIFVYRCFILQCLTELLSCYNRTKVEFINFSRKAPPQAMTPTKPRSGVLNYLLNELIPVGTLTHAEDSGFRKTHSTSIWAITVIVSLCIKTGERGLTKETASSDGEDESDLLFVRKFVLEHALKAYKDAGSASEPMDAKYARMMSLADLFNHLLIGRVNGNISVGSDSLLHGSPKHISKIMYEKNFIAALTTSIAEIDLNFPLAKRAVKYILRPLKLLTQTAIDLSESSSIPTTPGQTDEGEISSATSVSDMEEGREETPDLFRNSTLGMFEPGREDESSSDSSDDDEEMYDDGYGDEMEYDEEMHDDDNDVVSDEDEELGHVEGLSGDVGLDVEVVLNGPDEGRGSDSDSEDTDEMDEDDEIEVVDEINGDDENASLAGDADEWQSEDDDEDAEYEGGDDLGDHGVHGHHDSLDHIVRALEGDDGGDMLQHLQGGDLNMDMDPEDLSEDEEDDDDMDDEEVIYEAGFDDEDANLPWGWDVEGDGSGLPRGHHHHHHHHTHHRRGPGSWSLLGGAPRDPGMILPSYRSHRPTEGQPRGNYDGSNPLLHRAANANSTAGTGRGTRPEAMGDWVHAIESLNGRRGLVHSDSPVSLINNLINAIGQGGPTLGGIHHHGGALHFHIGGGPPNGMPREVQAMLGLRQQAPESSRPQRDDPASVVSFNSGTTSTRWQEEARVLFGQDFVKKTHRIVNALLSVMVPIAMEEERTRKEKSAEAARKLQEQKEREAEEERKVKERAEKEAKEKEDKEKEAEEQEAAARAAAEAENSNEELPEEVQGAEVGPSNIEQSQDEQAMEGVEATQTENVTVEDSGVEEADQPSAQASRVHTMIRGRELDITGMDIDPEYLDALPEELREEVLMREIAERRSQATTSGEPPTDINQEFLEALPDDIRQELLEQEAQDRRRREREEARRRTATTSGSNAQPTAEDMDPASMLATLDPGLRQAILMEQDEDVLGLLPQTLAAEARALGGEHRLRHFIDPTRVNRTRGLDQEDRRTEQFSKKPPKRTIVQMLDKAGVATLLRLMFIPQQGSARNTLNNILQNVCENRQNRAEVVSLLLSILQDGSADLTAVERSFAHLSLRARQTALQKTPQTPKRTSTDQISQINSESSPLMVVQQCLSSLFLLVQYNPHIPWFFLTEHDATISLKKGSTRKGKAKENKAIKFALNSLLGLLDRKLIMESSTVMEQLSALLNRVTHPLILFLRKGKEKNGAEPDKLVTDQATSSSENPIHQPSASITDIEGFSGGSVTSTDSHQPGEATTNPPVNLEESNAQVSNAEAASGGVPNEAGEQKPKKERTLVPPVIPEYNLRLVVSILAARECSARTFRDTLSTINNLSMIPEAKEVFGRELLRLGQDLGRSILADLDELIPQIQKGQTGTDIEGMALAKFSPASSDQAKLLRVLTALDYLFEPKKNKDKSNAAEPSDAEIDESTTEKQDVLAALYEDSTSGPLWNKLSECLSTIRQREGMLTVATILLPLIEALMVVCKNTTLKSTPIHNESAKEFSVSTPPPEAPTASLERLFFNFTEEHRKILNDLVRQNPKLMSGTFSLLVKNPKVLDFDNKRNYFTRRLHARGSETRHSQPPLQLSVRRDQVFLDSYASLFLKSADEIKYGKLGIRFRGEEGVDAGGVTREWFQIMSRQMFNPDYALFTPVAADRTTFHPNRFSAVNADHHLVYFQFIGRIIGKALYEGRVLDCHFSRAVYKRILGIPVNVKDMETLDLDYYKSLIWMLENDITDIITETFSVESAAFGEMQTIDLKENGSKIPVTEENKRDYVRLVVEYRLTGSVREQLENFLKGFHDIVSAELVSIFNEQELELLISGLPDIDVDDWKNNSEYHNYSASSSQIQWFWRAVRSFDKEERAKLLQFVTGTSKVPLNGFKELEGMNGFSRFNIHRDYGNKDRLPSSHTCFNQLDLPEYDSYEALRKQVYTAMTAGSEYFGFA
ncbi:MAG: hypothetical protein M1837_002581 [Sclerophora amabilis]|nr:MAG: hypothetical protein M1837_002581 [Sclerophora amabilis]